MSKHSQDKNFDQKVAKLQRNIYSTGKGKIREAVLWRDISEAINKKGKPLSILDIGGGQGQLSLRLAKQGHRIVLNDISEQMLVAAKSDAQAQGVESQIEFIQCPLQELNQHLPNRTFDLVMCHAVFEWLAEPQQAMAVLAKYVKEDGLLSLMFYNWDAMQLSTLVYGNFDVLARDFKVKNTVSLNPQNPLKADKVENWLDENGLAIREKSGVRCFYDYMRDREMWSSKFDDILANELRLSRQSPYRDIARYLHYLCKPM